MRNARYEASLADERNVRTRTRCGNVQRAACDVLPPTRSIRARCATAYSVQRTTDLCRRTTTDGRNQHRWWWRVDDRRVEPSSRRGWFCGVTKLPTFSLVCSLPRPSYPCVRECVRQQSQHVPRNDRADGAVRSSWVCAGERKCARLRVVFERARTRTEFAVVHMR